MVSPGQLRAIRPPAPNIRLDRETRKGSGLGLLPFLLPALIRNRPARRGRHQGTPTLPPGTADRASPSRSHSSVEPSVEQCPPAQKAVASPLPPPANLARCLSGSVPLTPASQQRISQVDRHPAQHDQAETQIVQRRTVRGAPFVIFERSTMQIGQGNSPRRHAPSRAVIIAIPAHELWHAH